MATTVPTSFLFSTVLKLGTQKLNQSQWTGQRTTQARAQVGLLAELQTYKNNKVTDVYYLNTQHGRQSSFPVCCLFYTKLNPGGGGGAVSR